jgi:predicted MFS family arabinose efflux permease
VVDASEGSGGKNAEIAEHPIRSLLARPIFWAVMLGDGILNAVAIAGASHIVPIAIEHGTSPKAAALLLSVMGGASILGSILSGVLSDRIGAAQTLALAALGSAAGWSIVAFTGWLPAMALATLMMGACAASVFPPINVVMAQAFGAAALPRVMGLLGACMLPFTFGMPPAAGWLRDISGNYGSVMTTFISVCLLVALMFFLMSRAIARGVAAPAPVSASV